MNSSNSTTQKISSAIPSINTSKIPSSLINTSKIPFHLFSQSGVPNLSFKTLLKFEMASFIPWLILLFICTFIIII